MKSKLANLFFAVSLSMTVSAAHAELIELTCKLETTELLNSVRVASSRKDTLIRIATDESSMRDLLPTLDQIKNAKGQKVKNLSLALLYNDGNKKTLFINMDRLEDQTDVETKQNIQFSVSANFFSGIGQFSLSSKGKSFLSSTTQISVNRNSGVVTFEEHGSYSLPDFTTNNYSASGLCDVVPQKSRKF